MAPCCYMMLLSPTIVPLYESLAQVTGNLHVTQAYCLYPRTRLFKSWITLSTGQIAIQRISITKTICAILWIVIYPVDSTIHFSNNWGQVYRIHMENKTLRKKLTFSKKETVQTCSVCAIICVLGYF